MVLKLIANPRALSVLFDLDGTLVDSSAGILTSLIHALEAHNVSPVAPLDSTLIGPPLREIITSLCPKDTPDHIQSIMDTFKFHYDTIGCLMTTPFLGIEPMLHSLGDQGITLSIVTNKRAVPATLIIRHLQWSHMFSYVYSPDSFKPSSPSKSKLITKLLQDANIDSAGCCYIGDRLDDWYSARSNGIRFGWAKWGFSGDNLIFDDNSFVLNHPNADLIISKLG